MTTVHLAYQVWQALLEITNLNQIAGCDITNQGLNTAMA